MKVLIERMHEAGLRPLEPYPGVHEAWSSECETCGNRVSPHYSWIRSGGGGCAFCAGQRVTADQAVKRMLDAGLLPLDDYANTHTPWRSMCLTCAREVSPTHAHVGESGRGCIYCAERKVDPDEAATKMRSVGLEPKVEYPGARVPWPSICLTCKRDVKPHWQSINRGGGGCVYCAERRVVPAEVVAKMRRAGYEPQKDYPGTGVPWLSIHIECGREVSPTWGTIRAGGGGCRYCAPSGLDFNASALLYLITNRVWNAAKIGVTGTAARRNRLNHHRDNGWAIAKTWRFPSGSLAFRVEQEILKAWRNAGWPELVPTEAMPQGGHSETVALQAVSLEEIEHAVNVQLGQI